MYSSIYINVRKLYTTFEVQRELDDVVMTVRQRVTVTKTPGWAMATEEISSKVDVCEKAKHHTELFW